MSLLSFEVAYSWQSCTRPGRTAGPGRTATAAPFAAPPLHRRSRGHRAPPAGHRDRRRGRPDPAQPVHVPGHPPLGQRAHRPGRSAPTRGAGAPASAFVNGHPGARAPRRPRSTSRWPRRTPTRPTAAWPAVPGRRGPWRPMPHSRVFYTGTLAAGPHRVAVRTAGRAGADRDRLRLAGGPAPGRRCRASRRPGRAGTRRTWTAPATRCAGTGRSAGPPRSQRTGARRGGHLRHRRLPHHPGRGHRDPDPLAGEHAGAPAGGLLPRPGLGGLPPGRQPAPALFPAATLGNVYFGFPQERWVDLRQLDALKPMLRERVAMCAREGVRRGRAGRHRQLRPAVHHRLPPHPRRRAELPGLRVQPDPRGRDDRAVEELAAACPGGDASTRTARSSRSATRTTPASRRSCTGSRQYGITCTGAVRRARRAAGTTSHRPHPASPPASGSVRPSTPKTVTSAVPGRSATGHTRSAPSAAPCSPSRTVTRPSDST